MLAKDQIQTGDKGSAMTACVSLQMYSFAELGSLVYHLACQ